ncbi:hypothetical protein GALL_544680 [mine drainage metagenome]|uniref:Uncharacterized protein n=1 Tax=mine drainage metagenome TaxID=410659 RepID=A0A1J5NXK3_9ZZZZ
MQGDKAAGKALGFEFGQMAPGRIKRQGIDPQALQRLQHPVARQQRDFTLGGLATHQHSDLV